MPIQIVDSRKLSEDENVWLKDLYNRLDAHGLRRVITEIHRLGKDKAERIKAYFDVITRANKETLREVIKMSNSTLTLEDVFEEVGWIAKWEARSLEKVARNALAEGASLEFVQKITGLDIDTITSLMPQEDR